MQPTVGQDGGITTILPSPAESVVVLLVFLLLLAAVAVVVVLATRRGSTRRNQELDHWRERALRAEAERDLLRELTGEEGAQGARK